MTLVATTRASAWPAFLAGIFLVVAGGLLAWVLRAELVPGLQKVWPLAPAAADVPTTLPAELTFRPKPEKPKPRVWTLSEISTAITTLPAEIEALVLEGQQELRQLEDPGKLVDQVKQQRAQKFLESWGRTFNNRVKLLEKKMPPKEACTPFASMSPGCRAIHIALDSLHRATNMTTVASSRKTLDEIPKDLRAALAPPEPPPATETP